MPSGLAGDSLNLHLSNYSTMAGWFELYEREDLLMRTLLIASLAILVSGCACVAPSQLAMTGCQDATTFACIESSASGPGHDQKPSPQRANPGVRAAKDVPLPRSAKLSVEPGKTHDHVASDFKSAPAAVPKASPAAQPSAPPDQVLDRARMAVAAKMDDLASVELVSPKRALRKNTLGAPLDSICGHVKGKTASGADMEERPFLYLVQENEAYIVNGSADITAAAAYRNICN